MRKLLLIISVALVAGGCASVGRCVVWTGERLFTDEADREAASEAVEKAATASEIVEEVLGNE